MTQVVECLLNKRKALNSSLSTEGKKKKEKRKRIQFSASIKNE
jgi:hypothetical protein